MPFPILPVLLALGAVGTAAVLIASKNVRGEDVPLGQRNIAVFLLGSDGPSLVLLVEYQPTSTLASKWRWQVPDWNDEMGEPFAGGPSGVEVARRKAFNTAYTYASQMSNSQLGLPVGVNPAALSMQLDFLTAFPKLSEGTTWENPGESLIFRASIIATSGGWLTQITDPSASVKFLKTYPSKAKALHEVFNFVDKTGY